MSERERERARERERESETERDRETEGDRDREGETEEEKDKPERERSTNQQQLLCVMLWSRWGWCRSWSLWANAKFTVAVWRCRFANGTDERILHSGGHK